MDEAEFAQAASEGEARARLYPRAVAARFLARRNRLLVRLSTGAEISVPVPSLEGLDDASPWALREIEITPAGTGLHFPRIDADLYVPALIERATRPCQGYTQEDWDAVSDNPPLTDEELAGLQPGPAGLPLIWPQPSRAGGGRPKPEAKRVAISLRVDSDGLAARLAAGPGWQARMHETLRRGVASFSLRQPDRPLT